MTFSPSIYNIIEGETVNLNVILNLSADYSVSVTLNTEDGTSTGIVLMISLLHT